ncbi:MAG: BMP family protein [Anaerolineaceae bacterium]|nr:BMP family protein [Anaerolineaceae bacterium]
MAVTIVSLLAACAPAATQAPAAAEPTKAPAAAEPTKAPAAAEPTKAEAPKETAFKAGLLAPGPVNDGGWNQTAYEALKKMEADLGAEISYVETEQSPAAFEKAFRDFASQGYTFILGHGNEYTDAALTVAPEYPNTFFFLSSSRQWDPKVPNVVGLNSDSSQPCYVFGYIAAKMGKGAGLIGGMEIPPISESFTGFINGAKAADPNFPVKETYLGNWTDTAAAKEAGISYVDGGADFLLGNADFATNGVFQAMAEKNVNGFSLFGDNTDKAPKSIVANYILDYGEGLVELAAQVKAGTFKPTSNYEFGLKDSKVIWFTYNDNAANPVPADLRKEVEDLVKKIESGEINTLAK